MIKLLSLHFTDKCTRTCLNCYLRKDAGDSKEMDFFLGLPNVCKALSIEQIALGGGEPTLFPDFVERFGNICSDNGIILNMTTNGDHFNEENLRNFKTLTMVSFSMDRFKVVKMEDATSLFFKMDLARKNGLKVGCNLQLDKFIIENIYEMIAQINNHADLIFLLQPKPAGLQFDSGLKKKLLTLSHLYGNIFVDDSIQLTLGFSKSCKRGLEILSLNWAGGLSRCSFDEPFTYVDDVGEIKDIVNSEYPFEPTTHCPFL